MATGSPSTNNATCLASPGVVNLGDVLTPQGWADLFATVNACYGTLIGSGAKTFKGIVIDGTGGNPATPSANTITSSGAALTLSASSGVVIPTGGLTITAGGLTVNGGGITLATGQTISSASVLTLDAGTILNIGTSSAPQLNIGKSGVGVTFPGSIAVQQGIGSVGNLTVGASLGTWAVAATSGTVSLYNNEATAGVGHPYIRAEGRAVTSNGGATKNIAQLTNAAAGFYRAIVVMSGDGSNNDASGTIGASWTDGTNSSTPTPAIITGGVTANATTWGSIGMNVKAGTTVTVRWTNSATTSTVAYAIIERLTNV